MVDSGQPGIRPVSFASHDHPGVQVEVLRRADVLQRVGLDFFAVPDRPSFDTLMLVHEGHGTHTVDFEAIPLKAGRLLRTRPGQVQTWDVENDIEATLVLSRTPVSAAPTWFPGYMGHCDLGPDSLATAGALIDVLDREQNRFSDDEPSNRLMTSLFGALSALFDREQPPSPSTRHSDAYVAFRSAIETTLGSSHNVRDYATGIGYSERTISRACQRVTGLTAKGLLNQRLVLEAKRLLAHTDKPAAAVAADLGFSEPTNFHKFFTRHTKQRPTQFRAANRVTSGLAQRH